MSDSAGPSAPALSLNLFERLFILVILIIAAASWVGVTLAELHLFSAPALFTGAALLAAGLVAFALRELRNCGGGWTMDWREGAALTAILALASVLFFHPGQYVFAGSDASIYLAIGTVIEKTGGITYSDPLAGDSGGREQARACLVDDNYWRAVALFVGPTLYMKRTFLQTDEGVANARCTLIVGKEGSVNVNTSRAVSRVFELPGNDYWGGRYVVSRP